MKNQWSPYLLSCVLLNIVSIALLLLSSEAAPMMKGVGLAAYLLGLRHAFDADHIAAIDNTVRKLIEENRPSSGVGFFFSLGHSSVVLIMSVALSLFVHWSQQHFSLIRQTGSWIGATISGLFLIAIAMVNLVILIECRSAYRHWKENKQINLDLSDHRLWSRGPFVKLFHRLFRLINHSYQIYPIGFLFGLGFDTTTEIALLALSAGMTKSTISFAAVLALPMLFASGMVVVDTLDSILMTKAYKLAFHTPIRKLYYNIIVTSLSVTVALIIGSVELGQVLSSAFEWKNAFWFSLQKINFNAVGYGLVFIFLTVWLTSFIVWKKHVMPMAKQEK
ncbi:HoxN/HupN/NixA family nickel/cobalt transporter [Sporolactobacillus sp. THM7-7]|nr:HoxN/HupN/NixA family nickel/cobalt transporter [Sporolactobacillus sp. THM7-7]